MHETNVCTDKTSTELMTLNTGNGHYYLTTPRMGTEWGEILCECSALTKHVHLLIYV
jgi:hypothetical protein